jgi:hypothetical protein
MSHMVYAGVPPLLLAAGVVFAILGFLATAVVIYFVIDEKIQEVRFDDQFEFAPGPIDRGAALPDYVNPATLRTLATHGNLEEPPAQVENSQGSRVSGGLPKGLFTGRKERGTKVTHEPHDDLGELIRRVLRHLVETGELNQTIDTIQIDDLMVEAIPNFADPKSASEAFEAWFEQNYPNGLDGVATPELVEQLSRLGQQFPEKKICERLCKAFEATANSPDSPLFLEGEWLPEEANGTIVLRRTDLRIASGHYERRTERSIPMPDGVSITARLEGELTEHGKNRMVGVSRPVRASVLATVKQYVPDTSCFELVPIAVFQRIGSA